MFRECAVLDEGIVLDLRFRSREDYRLTCRRHGRVLAELSSARPYEFKSVEKLRYDFERAIEDALRQG